MAQTPNYMIEIEHLNKSFGTLKAVDDLTFTVKRGELFAFLGVNGAGKSTTISMISGQLKRDSGIIKVAGHDTEKDISKVKEILGVVFQESVLDKPLTVRENLKNRAALYGIHGENFEKRLEELKELLDFGDYIDRQVGKLSGGQRRRIDIARALIHKPKLLILDEPTTGLDPQTRKLIWQIIEKLRNEKKMTVLLTTHYMEEAAGASNVVIIDHGGIVAKGTPHELKTKFVRDYMILYGVREDAVKQLGMPYEKMREGFKVSIPSTVIATDLIIKYPKTFRDYEIIKGGMDDVFLTVTGKSLGGEN